MQVLRGGQAQGALQQHLAGRIVGEVGAAHHMGDALQAVIDDHGQLIGPQAIGPAQHEVADAVDHVLLLGAHAAVLPAQHGVVAGKVVQRKAPGAGLLPCRPSRQVPG